MANKYYVTIDGKTTDFNGSNAFIDSLRTINSADKGIDGIAQHDTAWYTDEKLLTVTVKGQKVGMPA